MNSGEKFETLENYLSDLLRKDVAIAFSGGVDSTLLLSLCKDAALKKGTRVVAVTVDSEMHPLADLESAKKVAAEMGVEHLVLRVDELHEAGIGDNPPDRCYRCKFCLFDKLRRKASEMGIDQIVEGTNEDDLHVYRPGLRALEELSIISPLALFHITKSEVRQMALKRGISVAGRPSSPCMATRFPYGTTLTYEKMRLVDEAENYLRSLGLSNIRVRVHGEVARLEVDPESFGQILSKRSSLVEHLKSKGFSYITLDLEGFRSGSMDINLETEK